MISAFGVDHGSLIRKDLVEDWLYGPKKKGHPIRNAHRRVRIAEHRLKNKVSRKMAPVTDKIGSYHSPQRRVLRRVGRGIENQGKSKIAGAVIGAGATGYGIYQKSKVSKSKKEEAGGALLGAGATTAGGSVIGERILRGQAQRWSDRATNNLNEAHRLVPRLKPQTDPKWAYHNANKVFAGKSRKTAEQAGRLRGAAFQQQYFSDIYRGTAKAARKIRNPALATAAVGGGLLLLKDKK